MNMESLRAFCLALPDATEDIKWGQDLVFSVGAKMFCVVNTEPPHQVSFKTTPEDFADLVEREGMRPAPYLARAVWVQEERLGQTLDHHEAERLIRQAYELVRARLPKKTRAGAKRRALSPKKRPKPRVSGARRSRAVPARARRRRR
jgi:predicted DNA-binding protein (MmcQ/YjbR family)